MNGISAAIRQYEIDRATSEEGDVPVERLAAILENKAVIVSRHAGAIEWLAEQGVVGPVVAQATTEDVRGRIVIGNLPLHLAAIAEVVGNIDLPGLTAEQRGKDLTPEEMDAAGAAIRWYAVESIA